MSDERSSYAEPTVCTPVPGGCANCQEKPVARFARSAMTNVWPAVARMTVAESVATVSSSEGAGDGASAGTGSGVCATAAENEAQHTAHVAAASV